MAEDDPPRLKHGANAPAELVRALEALSKGADEAPRLSRVAAKLGPLLDAPPASIADAATSYKLTAIKLIIGGLALLAPVLWMMRGEHATTPAAVVARKPEPPVVVASPTAPSAPTAPAPLTQPVPERAATERGDRDDSQRVKPRTHSRRPTESTSPGDTAPAVAAAPAQAASEVDETPQVEPQPPAPERATKPASPSEAALLLDAHAAMPADPRRALRILAEHEKRFPNGTFVPEREVLAIEALRSLGRTTEADARLRRFQARYPDSFHLQRLQR